MYLSLYRKWRPRTFSDVIGQDVITATLRNQIIADTSGHAYLFCGTRGTGKTTCAKILAKAINCENTINGDPCNECEICTGVNDGSLTDVVEIDAASNNGVENIRDIREETTYTPITARKRIYIIDEVHMLSTGAFNALLKTLEEPPAHVVFILATTELHKVPATILSRCQRYNFKRVETEEIASLVMEISKKENIEIEEKAAYMLSALADGAVRDALSLLEQCRSLNELITSEKLRTLVGLMGSGHLYKLMDCVKSRDIDAALTLLKEIYSDTKDVTNLITDILSHYRNMMMAKIVRDPKKLLNSRVYDGETLLAAAECFSMEEILYAINTMEETHIRIMRANVDRKLELECAVIKLCNPRLSATNDALLARISELEASVAAKSSFIQTKNTAKKDKAEIDKTEENIEYAEAKEDKNKFKGKEDGPYVDVEFWTQVKDSVKSAGHKILYGSFGKAKATMSGEVIRISVEDEFIFNELLTKENRDVIRNHITAVSGKTYDIKFGLDKSAKINTPFDELIQKGKEQGLIEE